MEKQILIYRWGALGEQALVDCLAKIATCVEFAQKLQDYHSDGDFAEKMLAAIHHYSIEAVFSYDYFPLISMLCEMNQIPYISWIYDCPMTTLMSKTLTNGWNYIFCFDAVYTQRLSELGAQHVYHCPLAADIETLENIRRKEKENPEWKNRFRHQISFVGNLYNGEKNRLRRAELSEYAHGYVEGLIGSQLLVYGYNLLADAITPQVIEEIVQKCDLTLSEKYIFDKKQLAADAIGVEVTARERELVVKRLSESYALALYSSHPVEQEIRGKLLREMGYVDYEKEMPYVFHNSQINLNMTSKTIQSGIPQRVLDILACGGFCLTNYQPEIAEYFEDGKELVMYTSLPDLMEKVGYYMQQEEKRREIAENGNRKVKESFSLEQRVREILEMVF